jgi:hypothetical protein
MCGEWLLTATLLAGDCHGDLTNSNISDESNDAYLSVEDCRYPAVFKFETAVLIAGGELRL